MLVTMPSADHIRKALHLIRADYTSERLRVECIKALKDAQERPMEPVGSGFCQGFYIGVRAMAVAMALQIKPAETTSRT